MAVQVEVLEEIAIKVARRWRRKGVKSYSFDDIKHDALVAMLPVRSREVSGSLESYLWRVAINATGFSIAKAICPVTASKLGAMHTVTQFSGEEEDLASLPQMISTDVVVHIEKRDICVRAKARVVELTQTSEDAYGVRVLLGEASNAVATSEGVPVRLVYAATLRMRRRFSGDRLLFKIAKERHDNEQ